MKNYLRNILLYYNRLRKNMDRLNKPFKTLFVSVMGDVSIKTITHNDLEKYELGVLQNKYDYPLSVAVKLFTEYEDDEECYVNVFMNKIFDRNDTATITGDVYILLDPFDNDDDNKKFNRVFMKVYKNLKENRFMGRTDKEKEQLQMKMKMVFDELFEDYEKNTNIHS